jgi:hypothetical protein
MCHSYAGFPCWFCIYGTFLMYSGVYPSSCYYFHRIHHYSVCVSGSQYTIRIPGVTVITSNVMYVLFISGAKCSSCLSNVFHWTIHTLHLVDSTSTISVNFEIVLWFLILPTICKCNPLFLVLWFNVCILFLFSCKGFWLTFYHIHYSTIRFWSLLLLLLLDMYLVNLICNWFLVICVHVDDMNHLVLWCMLWFSTVV